MNDGSRRTYNTDSAIKFKMSNSGFCDYSDAHMLVKGTILVGNIVAQGADENNNDKQVLFKNCAPFTDCIREINNTLVDNSKGIDVVMLMYNLIEYSDKYSEDIRILMLKKDVEKFVPSKQMSSFWRTLLKCH